MVTRLRPDASGLRQDKADDHKGSTPDSYRELTTLKRKKYVVPFMVRSGHRDLR